MMAVLEDPIDAYYEHEVVEKDELTEPSSVG
jgi:hypothetical protein